MKLLAGTWRPAGEEIGQRGKALREPGAGRAKLRLSRGLPLCLTLQRQPPEFSFGLDSRMIYWVTSHTGFWGKPRFGRSLTLPGASPYLRRGSLSRYPPSWLLCSVWRCAESSLGLTRPPAAASPLTSFCPSLYPPLWPLWPLCDASPETCVSRPPHPGHRAVERGTLTAIS
jgi:hypothetical protein